MGKLYMVLKLVQKLLGNVVLLIVSLYITTTPQHCLSSA